MFSKLNKHVSSLKALFVIGILVVMLGILSIWQYVAVLKDVEKMPETTQKNTVVKPNEIDISNWETYRDITSGYSIQYPSEWEFESQIPSQGRIATITFTVAEGQREYWLSISIHPNPNNLSSEQWTDKLIQETRDAEQTWGGPTLVYDEINEIQIDGLSGLKLSNVYGGTVTNYEIIYLSKDGQVYEFKFPTAKNNTALANPLENNKIVLKMLSTFKVNN